MFICYLHFILFLYVQIKRASANLTSLFNSVKFILLSMKKNRFITMKDQINYMKSTILLNGKTKFITLKPLLLNKDQINYKITKFITLK